MNPEIRKFTKEKHQDERNYLADQIRQKRRGYFERQSALGAEMMELDEMVKEGEAKVSEQIDLVKAIELRISQKKASFISKLVHFFELRCLRAELKEQNLTRESIESEYREEKEILDALDEAVDDKHELDDARKILTQFYGEKNLEWNEYNESLEARDVRHLIEIYNVIFIHGIRPDFIPGSNSPLEKGVDWETKLRILMAFSPSIATSTINEGSDWRKMWSRMGVILNGGSVVSADSGDLGSKPTGLKKRGVVSGNIKDDITKSITHKTTTYNELTVNDPEIVGFYVCLDDISEDNNIETLVATDDIVRAMAKYKMPIYVIKNGIIFETEYDESTRQLKLKNELKPSDVLKLKFELDKDKKTRIKEDIISESPFKIISPEMTIVESSVQGRQMYIELNFRDARNQELADNPKLAEFSKIGGVVKYSIESGMLISTEKKNRTQREDSDIIRPSGMMQYINIGPNTWMFENAVNNSEDYLVEMEKVLLECKKNLEECTQGADESLIVFYKNLLARVVFHLYGFAEQAEEMGDIDVHKKALELAGSYLDYEEYTESIEKRRDSNGNLNITEEDLQFFTT